jgi:serine/threonine protein kinase
MAPEIHICAKDKSKPYDPFKTDIFALGVTIFAVMLGKLPFEYSDDKNQLYSMIMERKFDKFWSFHSSIHKL